MLPFQISYAHGNLEAASLRKSNASFEDNLPSTEWDQTIVSGRGTRGKTIEASLSVTSLTISGGGKFQSPSTIIYNTFPVKPAWKNGSTVNKSTRGAPNQLSFQIEIFSPVPTIHKELSITVSMWILIPDQTEDLK